jgi:hypothetical protein
MNSQHNVRIDANTHVQVTRASLYGKDTRTQSTSLAVRKRHAHVEREPRCTKKTRARRARASLCGKDTRTQSTSLAVRKRHAHAEHEPHCTEKTRARRARSHKSASLTWYIARNDVRANRVELFVGCRTDREASVHLHEAEACGRRIRADDLVHVVVAAVITQWLTAMASFMSRRKAHVNDRREWGRVSTTSQDKSEGRLGGSTAPTCPPCDECGHCRKETRGCMWTSHWVSGGSKTKVERQT